MKRREPEQRPDLRVSTADRSEVADMLSQHYAEGRLDATEFNERIELATTAKTRADLTPLLTDLPGSWTHSPAPVRPRHHRLRSVVVLAFLATATVWALATPHVVWLLAAVAAYAVWRHLSFSGHRCAGGAPEVGSGS